MVMAVRALVTLTGRSAKAIAVGCTHGPVAQVLWLGAAPDTARRTLLVVEHPAHIWKTFLTITGVGPGSVFERNA